MLKFVIPLTVTLLIVCGPQSTEGQCARCSSGGSGSVRYSTSHQPQYESTVTRHESQPVYYYPSEGRYSHSPPSEQVVYRQPSYQQTQYYESQPAVTYHTRRVVSEPYPYNQGHTRYYTQSQPSQQVVYRDYNTQGNSPCSGGSSYGSGGVRSCGSY